MPPAQDDSNETEYHVGALDDKVIAITGAGRGIGRAVALARSRQRSKLQLRVRGTLDALRGKMGHTPGLP